METTPSMFSTRKIPVPRLFRFAGPTALALVMTNLLVITGCSSNGSFSNLKVGAIAFTDVNGTPQKTPPTALTVGQGTYVDVVLTGDPQLLGANWSAYCGSALPPGSPLPPGQTQDESCGTFTPAHTMSGPIPSYLTSGSGYVTLYTAPATPPKDGTVTLYAMAASDPSKFSSVTLTIGGLPISIGFAPAPPPTLEVGATTQFRVALNNDAANAGASWSVICGSSDCGSFSPTQTTTGVTTTYTAPATVPTGGTVQVTATAIADPTKAVSATIAITAAASDSVIAGTVRAAQQPVAGAEVALYAAMSSEAGPMTATNGGDASAKTTAMTDEDGNFSLPLGYECPTPQTQMYVVSSGGSAGGGINPNLMLMAALGPCANLGASRLVVNEVTTASTVYALSGFMADTTHVGSTHASPDALATAFATARDLVDVATGLARVHTVSGKGRTPQAKIDTLGNLLGACATTAGSSQGDGSACDQLFRATNPGSTPSAQADNTIQALLDLARNVTGFVNRPEAFAKLNELATSSPAIEPSLSSEPGDWTLSIQFPAQPASADRANAEVPLTAAASPGVDAAGNVWVEGSGHGATEFVGGASCAGAPKILVPLAAGPGSAPPAP